MGHFGHILFPIDFSPQTSAVIPYVAAFARRLDSKVTLLSVVPPIWVGRAAQPERASDLEISTKHRLERTVTAEVHGLAVERVVRSGEAAEQIAAYARDNAVDLVMMPTHGYGVFRSALIGSVTAKVLHDAACPVWTAAHAAEQHARLVPEAMLCCVDGTPKSVELMRWAADFSARWGARLQLVHVIPPVSDWGAIVGDGRMQEAECKAAQACIDVLRAEAGVDAPLTVAVGAIATMVAEHAKQAGADLIIIGRGQIGATLGRLRTHAYRIIQHSPCPVVSV